MSFGASNRTLIKRAIYGGRKGRSAEKRLARGVPKRLPQYYVLRGTIPHLSITCRIMGWG